jgi:integrase
VEVNGKYYGTTIPGTFLEFLGRAPRLSAKSRNHMSALFSHCIRHELYCKLNPIAPVRQSAVRQRDPDILTLDEMRSIINNIKPAAIKMMVAAVSASALRRSEVRGLKWADLDLDKCWFNLQRGYVSKSETKMKTKASRKGMEMLPAWQQPCWSGVTIRRTTKTPIEFLHPHLPTGSAHIGQISR